MRLGKPTIYEMIVPMAATALSVVVLSGYLQHLYLADKYTKLAKYHFAQQVRYSICVHGPLRAVLDNRAKSNFHCRMYCKYKDAQSHPWRGVSSDK